jgi:hypothetical protein
MSHISAMQGWWKVWKIVGGQAYVLWCQPIKLIHIVSKAELPLEGIFFTLNFLPWEFLLVKKLEIEKTKTTKYTAFKTDIIKVVLVFSISKFFTNEKSQVRKLSAV